jgi:undecaprenyl pyrophosphate phosphatase UppP
LFSDLIDELLESPVTVAVSLLLGGIVLLKLTSGLIIQRTLKYLTAFKIGLYQCLAMVPGFLEVAPALWVECLKTNSYISLNFHFSCCPTVLAQRQKNVTIITKMVLY